MKRVVLKKLDMDRAPNSQLFAVPLADDAADPAGVDVLRLCDPGAAVLAGGPLTFSPPANGDEPQPAAWTHWQEQIFAPLLGPVLLSATRHATAGHARELAVLSGELHAQLSPAVAARLRGTGRALLRQLAPVLAAHWLGRLSQWAAQGEPAACFPVVFAGWCALFHLPVRSILLGYAACEWHAATRAPRRGVSLLDQGDEIRRALRAGVPAWIETILHDAGANAGGTVSLSAPAVSPGIL